MFIKKEKRLVGEGYFTIIRETERDGNKIQWTLKRQCGRIHTVCGNAGMQKGYAGGGI